MKPTSHGHFKRASHSPDQIAIGLQRDTNDGPVGIEERIELAWSGVSTGLGSIWVNAAWKEPRTAEGTIAWPSQPWNPRDSAIMRAVSNMLKNEDLVLFVRFRPRPIDWAGTYLMGTSASLS